MGQDQKLQELIIQGVTFDSQKRKKRVFQPLLNCVLKVFILVSNDSAETFVLRRSK
jgi:hypothetical protein